MSEDWKTATSVYDFTVKDIKGQDVSLEKYKYKYFEKLVFRLLYESFFFFFNRFRGSVLIIVNVASKCGYTSKHYKELAELDEKYRDKGLKILAFPCNQFGNQVNVYLLQYYNIIDYCKKIIGIK